MSDPPNILTPGRANAFVALLSVMIALNFMDRQVLAIVAEPVKHEFGLSDTQLGVLTGAVFALLFAFASIPIAWAADRVNRVWVLSLCATLWSLFTMVMGAATGFQQLVVARMGLAIGEAGCNPCAQSLIADYVPSERRAQALAIYAMGVPAGLVAAGIVGGQLADRFGWRAAFLVLGAVSLLVALLAAWVLPEPRGARRVVAAAVSGAGVSAGTGRGYRILLAKPAFRYLIAGSAVGTIASVGSLVWGTVFIVRYFAWTPGEAGAVFGTLGAVVGLGGTWLGGKLSDVLSARDKRWRMWLPAIALVLATPFGFVGAFATAISVLFVTASAEAFFRTLTLAPAAATLQGLSPNDARARAAATSGVVGNLIGFGLGPTIVGVLSDALTPQFGADALRYGMVSLMIPQLIAAYLLWRAARTLEADLID